MKYEIKKNVVMKDGRKVSASYIATEVELTNRNGLDAIKFLEEGKKRYTWIEVPNDYQMQKYTNSFEAIITEATTGRRLHAITK